jgi:hypothetical protein
VQSRDFHSPDETRTPDKTQVDVVRMGSTTAARLARLPRERGVMSVQFDSSRNRWVVRCIHEQQW